MTQPKKMGRPPKHGRALMVPVTIRFPVDMMDYIEQVMTARMDHPEKGQVIRELVAEAIAARKGKR